jgi:hypothetical protein
MTVLAMAVALGVLSVVVGHWSTGVLMALLLVVLLGAVWTPIALLALGGGIVYQVIVHGPEVFAKSNQLVGGKP